MVGQGGADPPTPEGNGFTARRSCRFATDPYNGTPKGTRTYDPLINSQML